MPKETEETEQLLREIESLRLRVTSLEKREPGETQADSETEKPFQNTGTPLHIPETERDHLISQVSEQTSRALLNATADSALLIDKKGIILDANENMAASLGKSRAGIIGTVIYDHLPPDIAAERKAKGLEAAEQKKLIRFEDYRDGRWLENSAYPVFNPEGELIQFAIFSRDITEQKTTEKALRESERYYRTLFESASDAIFIMEQVHFVACNQQGLNMYACTRNQIIGKTLADFSPQIQPDGQDSKEKAFKIIENVRQGIPQFFEWRHQKLDGGLFDAEVHLAPLNLQDQNRFIAIVRDITERKKAEESLNNALAEVHRLKEQAEAENIYLNKEIQMAHLHGDIIGQSESIKSVLSLAEQVAKTDSTALILGETGTGKELLARAIHNMSPRRDYPLVTVNCAAIPGTLVESELFGREKGAFTGAFARQIGRFEIANRSTIFLDEIGELSMDVQAKLLRVIQEGQIERLGSARTIHIDVRIIAATNRDLDKEIKAGKFREDLFYRLNVFPIFIPPLRDRKEDISELVWHFVDEIGEKMGKRIEKIPQQSIDTLLNHNWPGNIRELHNVIERAMIRTQDNALRIPSMSQAVRTTASAKTLAEVEKHHIIEVLNQTGWRIRGKDGAAEILGIKPTTLESRMQKRNIKRPRKTYDYSYGSELSESFE